MLYFRFLICKVGQRGLLLFAFAIIEMHIRPHMYGYSSEYGGYLLALLGFVLLFPIYTRFSESQDYLWKFEKLHDNKIQWAIRGTKVPFFAHLIKNSGRLGSNDFVSFISEIQRNS